MSQHDAADLEWLAFQYVSDDLPAGEVAPFEERLASDQAAREAVAQAMLLLQAVTAGARVAAPAPRQRFWLQQAGWAAVGAAACLAIVFVARPAPRETSLPHDIAVAERPQAADLTSAELALVWAMQYSASGSGLEDRLEVDEDLSLTADAREDRDVVVPPWMLEALSGSDEAKPPVKQSQES